MRSRVVAWGDLGADLVLAPERHLARAAGAAGPRLGDLVTIAAERVEPAVIAREEMIVIDTTHAKDGLLDVRSAARPREAPTSPKNRLRPGDLVVSRLRPYLRQIALVHARAVALAGGRALCGSTELVVLRPRPGEGGIAFLLPLLLSDDVQEQLARGQEGGHHPRVARDTLLSVPVPDEVVRGRARTNARVEKAIARVYDAVAELEALVGVKPGSRDTATRASSARQR